MVTLESVTARAQDLTPLPPARTRPGLWSTSIYGGGTMFLPANGQLEYERTGKWYDGKINFDAGYTVGGFKKAAATEAVE